MAEYRINGYDVFLAFGFSPDGDKSTSNSFDIITDVEPVFSHKWPDGVVEYDLDAPVYDSPRLFVFKGHIQADTLDDYKATKLAIEYVIKQNYVTVECPDLDVKANAKLKPGTITWERKSNLDVVPIVTAFSFQMDEVLQEAPFKEDSDGGGITYYIDNEGNFMLTEDDENYIT